MSERPAAARSGDPSAFVPLPPTLNLERERRAAKAFLRELQAGDPDALARARARHPGLDLANPGAAQLSDAQLIIAREYGFASWPRLVQYYEAWERETASSHGSSFPAYDPDGADRWVQSYLREHAQRRGSAGRFFATRVPRFYGMSVEAVLDSPVTVDDARVVVARAKGYTSWESLLQGLAEHADNRPDPLARPPLHRAARALMDGDLPALQRIVAEHPTLLAPSEEKVRRGKTLAFNAVTAQLRGRERVVAPLIEWLVSQGLDFQLALDMRLCGYIDMEPAAVRQLLEQGANPDWIAPNGHSVLEHALIRYRNGEAVDLLASHLRVPPPPRMWIGAGLGDIRTVARFLDRGGRPTPEAYRTRPPLDELSPTGGLMLPEPDDYDILSEAFIIALQNDRLEVMEYMVERGFPINRPFIDSPLISFAIEMKRVRIVECLLRCGANLDIRGYRPEMTPREIARERFAWQPDDPDRRRILELCNAGDPDQILAQVAAQPAPEPVLTEGMRKIFASAGDDAARLGQSTIGPENLFFALAASASILGRLERAGAEAERLRATFGERIRFFAKPMERGKLQLDAELLAVVQHATDLAREAREEVVFPHFLLAAMIREPDAPVSKLLAQAGIDRERLQAELTKMR